MRTTRLFIALVPMLAASLLLTVSIGRASEKTEGKTPWKITDQLEEAVPVTRLVVQS